MKATILNGALPGDTFVDAVSAGLQDILQTEGWTKRPGLCRIDEAGRDIARSVIQSDLAVHLTPITFGGYSSELKKAVDRIICLISPFFTRIDGEVHHRARYARYPELLGVGVLFAPHPAQEQIFHTLIGRNAINLHTPVHNSAVLYRSQEPAAATIGVLDPGEWRPEQPASDGSVKVA